MTTVPTKIVLKSTTRMSLNDRFSTIAAPSIQNIRANMAAEQQVSAANRRLAQQLANRPGLQGASGDLMYRNPQPNRMRGQQRSLQQRLGRGNVKNRLSLPPANTQQPMRGRGRGRGRGNNQLANQGAGNATFNRPRGRGTFVPRGVRARGGMRGGRGGYNRMTGQSTGTTFVRRGGNRGGNRGRGGRGRGGRGGTKLNPVSQQDLDAELDTYMAKTKSVLDTELDAYMAEVTS